MFSNLLDISYNCICLLIFIFLTEAKNEIKGKEYFDKHIKPNEVEVFWVTESSIECL